MESDEEAYCGEDGIFFGPVTAKELEITWRLRKAFKQSTSEYQDCVEEEKENDGNSENSKVSDSVNLNRDNGLKQVLSPVQKKTTEEIKSPPPKPPRAVLDPLSTGKNIKTPLIDPASRIVLVDEYSFISAADEESYVENDVAESATSKIPKFSVDESYVTAVGDDSICSFESEVEVCRPTDKPIGVFPARTDISPLSEHVHTGFDSRDRLLNQSERFEDSLEVSVKPRCEPDDINEEADNRSQALVHEHHNELVNEEAHLELKVTQTHLQNVLSELPLTQKDANLYGSPEASTFEGSNESLLNKLIARDSCAPSTFTNIEEEIKDDDLVEVECKPNVKDSELPTSANDTLLVAVSLSNECLTDEIEPDDDLLNACIRESIAPTQVTPPPVTPLTRKTPIQAKPCIISKPRLLINTEVDPCLQLKKPLVWTDFRPALNSPLCHFKSDSTNKRFITPTKFGPVAKKNFLSCSVEKKPVLPLQRKPYLQPSKLAFDGNVVCRGLSSVLSKAQVDNQKKPNCNASPAKACSVPPRTTPTKPHMQFNSVTSPVAEYIRGSPNAGIPVRKQATPLASSSKSKLPKFVGVKGTPKPVNSGVSPAVGDFRVPKPLSKPKSASNSPFPTTVAAAGSSKMQIPRIPTPFKTPGSARTPQ